MSPQRVRCIVKPRPCRLAWGAVTERRGEGTYNVKNSRIDRTALVLLLPGLGDALAGSPVLEALAAGGYRVHALCMMEPVAQYLRELPAVDEVLNLPLLHAGFATRLHSVMQLRKHRYDVAVVPFPATRWQYAAVAVAIGARKIVTHRYGGIYSALMRAAGAEQLPLQGGHKIFENVRMARSLGPAGGARYAVPEGWKSARVPGLLGIHSGSMNYKGNETKRWPIASFIEIARRAARDRPVRVFAGPNELEDLAAFQSALPDARVEYVALPLPEAAKKMSECEALIANDSGVAHLAAALGVKTLTLFGMTNPDRVSPVGDVLALRPSKCPPCHDEGSRLFECVRQIDFRCIRHDLDVESVWEAIQALFRDAYRPFTPHEKGPFRLYGQIREMTSTEI